MAPKLEERSIPRCGAVSAKPTLHLGMLRSSVYLILPGDFPENSVFLNL